MMIKNEKKWKVDNKMYYKGKVKAEKYISRTKDMKKEFKVKMNKNI